MSRFKVKQPERILPGTEAWPRGATPRLRSGVAAERSNTTSKEPQMSRCRRRAERIYSTFKVRRGHHEEIPLIQGKKQQLCFAGAAVEEIPHVQGKRNPSKMVGVARGIRGQTYKP